MILLMESDYHNPINIGNPREYSIKEIACLIRTIINPNLDFEYKNLPQDDPKQRNPNIDLAKKTLGWEPRIELNKGLSKTIDWFKSIT